jgi:hypothetical protein
MITDHISSEAYHELLKHIPQGANNPSSLDNETGPNHPAPINQQDYPHVKYWFKRDWSEHQSELATEANNSCAQRGRGRAAKGINVSMRYVEYENGEMISGDRATEIRRFARSIWVLLGKKGTPPATWGAADIETRKLYCYEMGERFNELRLCDLDWKAEQIATDNYPSWHNTWDSKTIQQDIRIEQGSSRASESGFQMKRIRRESMTFHSKRSKLEVMVIKGVDDASAELGMATTNLTPTHLTVGDTSVSLELTDS